MGLEVAPFINSFNSAWPLTTDQIRQGDDHIRMMKVAIKASFPNITAAMTKTAAQLNALPSNWAAVLAELLENMIPRGSIVAWSGSVGSIPQNWALCNGTNVAGYGIVPDLRNRFIVGAGDDYAVAETGGSVSDTSSSAGAHTPVITGHALTEDELPTHYHLLAGNTIAPSTVLLSANNYIARGTTSGGEQEYTLQGTATVPTVGRSSNVGDGDTHTHLASPLPNHTHAVSTMPPYYALCWMIKTGQYIAP